MGFKIAAGLVFQPVNCCKVSKIIKRNDIYLSTYIDRKIYI